jgi:hypothetical protein
MEYSQLKFNFQTLIRCDKNEIIQINCSYVSPKLEDKKGGDGCAQPTECLRSGNLKVHKSAQPKEHICRENMKYSFAFHTLTDICTNQTFLTKRRRSLPIR